jgi:DNA-binding NtrC family response regulator
MRLPADVYLAGVVETDELDGAPSETSEAAAAPSPAEAAIAPYRMARAEALAAFERSYLRRLIEATGGNASAAARAANMDRPYLLSLLRRHGLR